MKRKLAGLGNPAPPFTVLQGLGQNPQTRYTDLCPVVPFLNASQSLPTTGQQLYQQLAPGVSFLLPQRLLNVNIGAGPSPAHTLGDAWVVSLRDFTRTLKTETESSQYMQLKGRVDYYLLFESLFQSLFACSQRCSKTGQYTEVYKCHFHDSSFGRNGVLWLCFLQHAHLGPLVEMHT